MSRLERAAGRTPAATAAGGHGVDGREAVLTPWSPPVRGITVGMLLLIGLSAFESLAVTTTMPAVVTALGGLPLYAMAFPAPVASGVVGMVVAGPWAGPDGPAVPLLTAVGVFVVGLVLTGTAVAMPAVVAAASCRASAPGCSPSRCTWSWHACTRTRCGSRTTRAGQGPTPSPPRTRWGARLAAAVGAGGGAMALHWGGQATGPSAVTSVAAGVTLAVSLPVLDVRAHTG